MKRKFFYTTHKIHQYTPGPSVHTLNDDYDEIESLGQAQELALSREVKSSGDDRVIVSWGVMYSDDEF